MSTYIDTYITFLTNHLDLKKPITVIADASNGSTGPILEKLKAIPNLSLSLINEIPDGDFPAHSPNPLEPGSLEGLSKAVLDSKADFGVAFDADGDRAFFVDDTGALLPSFKTALLLFKNNKPPYIAEETLYQALKHLGLYTDTDLKASRVGSRFVKEALKAEHASAGGEFSGHYYFEKFFGLDSGIFAMVEVANVVSALDGKLSDFFRSIAAHEIINENVKIQGKNVADILLTIQNAYEGKAKIGHRDGITLDLGTTWISIRTSNTEPLLRLIAGAPTYEEAQQLIHAVKALV